MKIPGMRAARFLLAIAAVLAAIGGVMHGAAFTKASAAFAESNLPAFFAGSSRGLWLADSVTLVLLGIIFGLAAAWPATATRASLLLTALIPMGTAAMIYRFLGGFFAAHLLTVIAVLAFMAGLAFSREAQGDQVQSINSEAEAHL